VDHVKPNSSIVVLVSSFLAGLGTTAGAHRLWTHRAYKATAPLKLFLLICFCSAGQLTLYKWICDHRIHHKYSETDADPHNAKRGFFFAHVGWTMLDRHPEFLKKEPLIDMSDIQADKFVMFQKKYHVIMNLFFCSFLPLIIPIYFWNEEWKYAILSLVFIRFILILNVTWSVNSVAHLWGNKPYDK
jgi:stearoyl-CoA desaturase (Delta-9 desaturase)